MEIIFTETWMAWAVGIILALVALRLFIVSVLLVYTLKIARKLNRLVEEFGEWSSYAMDEATDAIEDFAKLRESIKKYMNFAGLGVMLTKFYKELTKKRR